MVNDDSDGLMTGEPPWCVKSSKHNPSTASATMSGTPPPLRSNPQKCNGQQNMLTTVNKWGLILTPQYMYISDGLLIALVINFSLHQLLIFYLSTIYIWFPYPPSYKFTHWSTIIAFYIWFTWTKFHKPWKSTQLAAGHLIARLFLLLSPGSCPWKEKGASWRRSSD